MENTVLVLLLDCAVNGRNKRAGSEFTKYLNKNKNYIKILEMLFIFNLHTVSTMHVVGCERAFEFEGGVRPLYKVHIIYKNIL
jgi:hypothetical protein